MGFLNRLPLVKALTGQGNILQWFNGQDITSQNRRQSQAKLGSALASQQQQITQQIATNFLNDADKRRRALLYSTNFNESSIGSQVNTLLGA